MKTTTEAQLREWVAQGLTQREIGLMLDTHQPTVSTALRVLGIKSTSHFTKNMMWKSILMAFLSTVPAVNQGSHMRIVAKETTQDRMHKQQKIVRGGI